MKLFTVGPVEMHPGTLDVASKQVPYFRTSEFSEITLDSERLLLRFAKAPEGSRALILTASGTGAMEAAVMNCFGRDDKLLVVVGGGFGRRFSEICNVHGIPHSDAVIGRDETLTREHLEAACPDGCTGLLINMDETTTGQLYDMEMVSGFCRERGLYLVVDAISAFMADPFDFGALGADVMVCSSQKALALSPGLSFLIVSPRMLPRIEAANPPSLYFDLKAYLKDMDRGQTPFTPAVGIMLELNERLHRIDEAGVDEEIARTARLAEHFRSLARGIGLEIPDYPLSNAVTPVIFPDGNAQEVFEMMKDRYDIMLTPSGGDLKGTILRVGHIGNHTEADYDELVEMMKEAMS